MQGEAKPLTRRDNTTRNGPPSSSQEARSASQKECHFPLSKTERQTAGPRSQNTPGHAPQALQQTAPQVQNRKRTNRSMGHGPRADHPQGTQRIPKRIEGQKPHANAGRAASRSKKVTRKRAASQSLWTMEQENIHAHERDGACLWCYLVGYGAAPGVLTRRTNPHRTRATARDHSTGTSHRRKRNGGVQFRFKS